MISIRSYIIALAGVFAIILTGCNPRAVESLLVDAPETLETNQSGDFSAMANEDARAPVAYSWDFGDGTTMDGTSVAHTFSEAGSYTVMVTASNRDGRYTVSESTNVMVMNPPVPSQVLAILTNPTTIDTQTLVELSANVRGDAPMTYAWDLGDGSTSSSPTPQHTFMSAGDYTVSLQLSNEHGQDSRSLDISVVQFEPAYCADLTEMNSVLFDRNSSVLSDDAMMTLSDNVEILGECLNLNARIEGMTSPFERNPQQLSEDRARALMDHYTSNGIDAERLSMVGLGSSSGSKKSGADQFQRADTIPIR
ncbi:MAG: PKD domain-containing protein [Bacteroidetes bacterium]|nr:PKD domain-containing protein [Bacteroidota bacterium]MCY4232548.1 PKD domain-containing protein [Bacteroidota bacterium]